MGIVTTIAPIALALLMLGLGASLTVKDFTRVCQNPKDFFIGLTGWICDPKRGAHLEELIPIIPLDRLLIETDSPYLLPKNLKVKGRRNEPSFLNEILKKIVEVRKETETEIKEALLRNSLYFFNLLK